MTLRICNPKTVFSCVKMIIDGLGGIEAFFFLWDFQDFLLAAYFILSLTFSWILFII